jgi:S1-C subfamily serine protease
VFTIRIVFFCSLCSLSYSQISQKDACQKFSSSIVRIDGGGDSIGTGFIVSKDGWIFTAAHVIRNASTGQNYETVTVTLPSGRTKLASYIPPIEANMAGRDYAILKIDEIDLTPLAFADGPEEPIVGSDLTIIGFPFSAIAFKGNGPSIKDKFCLSAQIASSGITDVPVSLNTPKGPRTVNVKVDVIYFQGPSVKGLSGSPLISRDTGHVIGILTSKLSGIDDSLSRIRSASEQGQAIVHASVVGVDLLPMVTGVINTLDRQLANGLGAATGIEDPRAVFRQILRQRSKAGK